MPQPNPIRGSGLSCLIGLRYVSGTTWTFGSSEFAVFHYAMQVQQATFWRRSVKRHYREFSGELRLWTLEVSALWSSAGA